MIRILFSLALLGLVFYIMFNRLGNKPASVRDSLASGIMQAKETAKLMPKQEQLLRLQLAIADYSAAEGKAPDDLEQLVPRYFDSVPLDPTTNKPFDYKREGRTFKLGALADAISSTPSSEESEDAIIREFEVDGQSFVNPNTIELEEFTYDPNGKRDPFRPFDFALDNVVDMSLPPLQRYSVGQLKLTAILAELGAGGSRTAIVEDATGRGYTIRKGTKIGNKRGVVISIDDNTVNILETVVDFTGKEKKMPVVMKISVTKRDAAIDQNLQRNKVRRR